MFCVQYVCPPALVSVYPPYHSIVADYLLHLLPGKPIKVVKYYYTDNQRENQGSNGYVL
jgi:hypothetical protein